jgi:hypothetical protein
LTAWVSTNPAGASSGELIEHLQLRVPSKMIPQAWDFAQALALGHTGKLRVGPGVGGWVKSLC